MELGRLELAWHTDERVRWGLWALLVAAGLVVLRAIGYRFSRVVGLIVLMGQLPGDVAGFVDHLAAEPLGALRSLSCGDVWHFVSAAVVFPRKMSVRGVDSNLLRLERIRLRYELEGWEHVRFTTADGVRLDGARHAPPRSASRRRWVIFFNANMQKYEEWFFYFHRYVREAKVGMLVFNWRGVAHSDGYITCIDDLVADGTAALRLLIDEGVDPRHILIHGLSIGACIAALVRARQPVGEHGPVLLDRPFSSLSRVLGGYVEFAMGPRPAAGKLGCRRSLSRALSRAALETLAAIVGFILVATGWEGRTLRGFRKLHAVRIVTYHQHDNIIHVARASLYEQLAREERAGRLQPAVDAAASPSMLARAPAVRWHVLELATPNEEWQPHDMPLFLDQQWFNILALLSGALGGARESIAQAAAGSRATAGALKPGPARGAGSLEGQLSVSERMRALGSLFGGRPAPARADVDEAGVGSESGGYVRML